jgi:hypothetical protein
MSLRPEAGVIVIGTGEGKRPRSAGWTVSRPLRTATLAEINRTGAKTYPTWASEVRLYLSWRRSYLLRQSAAARIRLHCCSGGRSPTPSAWLSTASTNFERTQRDVAGSFILHGNRVSFKVGDYDRSQELVIDASIVFLAYLGGSGADEGTSLTITSDVGITLAAGSTSCANFPVVSVAGVLGRIFHLPGWVWRGHHLRPCRGHLGERSRYRTHHLYKRHGHHWRVPNCQCRWLGCLRRGDRNDDAVVTIASFTRPARQDTKSTEPRAI